MELLGKLADCGKTGCLNSLRAGATRRDPNASFPPSLAVSAVSVSTAGFTLVMEARCNTRLWQLQVSWLAILPANTGAGQSFCSGGLLAGLGDGAQLHASCLTRLQLADMLTSGHTGTPRSAEAATTPCV